MDKPVGLYETDAAELVASMRRAAPLAKAFHAVAARDGTTRQDAFAASLLYGCELAAKAGITPEDFDRFAHQQYTLLRGALQGTEALHAAMQTLPRKDAAVRPTSPRRVLALVRPRSLDDGERGKLDVLQATLGPDRFSVATSRLDVRPGDLVVARHMAWPWPLELARDVVQFGGTMLNSVGAYHYADNPLDWSASLGDLTPGTWDRFEHLPEGMAFILKGRKADKRAWSRMYAPDKTAAIALRAELQRDLAFADQTIVARAYVPLERLGTNLGGLPISTEYRVFVCDGVELSRAFYWPVDDCDTPPPAPDVIPADFLREAIARVAPQIRFFVLDVARGVDGRWWVIEVNDGLRAGMSANDPAVVWRNLVDTVTRAPPDA